MLDKFGYSETHGELPRKRSRPYEYADGGWIKGAIKHPGAFKASAERAGKSTHEFAEEHKHDGSTTGRRARLALTLGKLRK